MQSKPQIKDWGESAYKELILFTYIMNKLIYLSEILTFERWTKQTARSGWILYSEWISGQ